MSATQNVISATRKNENTSLQAVAKRAGLPPARTRQILEVLVDLGRVEVASVKRTGKRGRPAFLYRRSA
jgi:predicted ArsR family transcriptional regulator